MHSFTPSILVLASLLPATAFVDRAVAQSYHSTLPSGHLKKGGDWNMAGFWHPFSTSTAIRYQEVHDDWSGSTRTLKGVAFRRAWGMPTNTTSVAHAASLFFRGGYGDLAKFGTGTTMDANFRAGRTTVVGSASSGPAVVNLPDWTKQGAAWSRSNPAPFSVILPFSTSFVHDGKSDFVWDVEVVKTSISPGYNTDRATVGLGQISQSPFESLPLLSVSGTCRDSSISLLYSFGAYAAGNATSYAKDHPSSLKDTTQIAVQSFGTAPNAVVIHALGFPSVLGIPVRAKCRDLHVNTVQPHVLQFHMTPNSATGYSPRTVWTASNSAAAPFRGIRFATQAAWTDSRTSEFALSRGATFLVPDAPRAVHAKYAFILPNYSMQGPYLYGSVITGWY